MGKDEKYYQLITKSSNKISEYLYNAELEIEKATSLLALENKVMGEETAKQIIFRIPIHLLEIIYELGERYIDHNTLELIHQKKGMLVNVIQKKENDGK